MLLLAAGLLALAWLSPGASTLDVVWRMAVCGVGYGMFHSPNNRTILAGAPRERTGAAQGILATARLCGQTLGAALVALVFGASIEAGRRAGVVNAGEITVALGLATAFALAAAAASYARRSSLRALPA
jgi:DHA2 family multidrug resistance protein-like MFS transporter